MSCWQHAHPLWGLLCPVNPTAQVCLPSLLLAWMLGGQTLPAFVPETCPFKLPRLASSHFLQCGPPVSKAFVCSLTVTIKPSPISSRTRVSTVSWSFPTNGLSWPLHVIYQVTLYECIYKSLGTPGCCFLETSKRRK